MSAPLRILIVEDEMTIAMMLEDMLAELGHAVAALATRLPQAKALAESAEVDLAVLDVNLGGLPSFPAAEILRGRGIPLLFSTGYGQAGIDPAFADAIVLGKPYRAADLAKAIDRALGA